MDRAKVAAAIAIAAIAWLSPAPALAQGCAMCKRALSSPEGQQLVAAFRSGILILLAAPFSLVAVIATLVVRMQRRTSNPERRTPNLITPAVAEPPSADYRA